MNTSPKLPITVICGFLGSGKTTLLRRWRDDEVLRDAAYIIHDLSEFGVDAELLADESSTPEQGKLVDRMAALHNRYGNLLPEEVELIKEKVEAVHPILGDRHNTLPIIGLPRACKTFADALRGALCTEQEVQAWQSGKKFSDPWPQKLRKQYT